MKLYEFEGKALLKKTGIPIPQGEVVGDGDSAESIARKIGFPMVVKSQLLQGGRGKAGMIRFAHDKRELTQALTDLRGRKLKGETIKQFLIEKRVSLVKEFFAGSVTSQQHCLESCAAGIDGRGKPSRSTSNDNQIMFTHALHRFLAAVFLLGSR